jgi:DNA invertase Pin-like site-specific DNA recombinase
MTDLAILYARYSPRPVKKNGRGEPEPVDSIATQLDRMHAYCRMISLAPDVILEEPATSAWELRLEERPEGQKLVELIRTRRYKHVVAQKLDRLWRDTADAILTERAWRKLGVTLHFADQGGCSINTRTATGRLIFRTLASHAEFERDHTSERTSVSMSRQAKLRVSGSCRIPWGRMSGLDDELVENPQEIAVAEEIRQLRRDGLSLRAIGRALEGRGILCRGKLWHPDTIRGIIEPSAAKW